MGRGRRTSLKCSNNQHVHMKSMHSEDSDEDYVAEADEIDDQSDELNSLVGDDSEEESCFEEMEEEEEDDEEEEDWRTFVKPRAQKGSARSWNNGIKRPKKRRKVTCDDNESSSDGDEEFTPDEIESLEEEEEFPLPKNKTKKRGRTTLKRRTPARSRRRKTSAKAVRKPLRKKSRKTGILRRNAKSGDEEDDFTEKGYTLRGRGKKKLVHRKKRVKSGSDSDFCSNSSDSSDYEFTISDEEREQVREANELCRRLTTNLRSTRRIQEDEDEALCKPRKPPVRKGKEKAEETKNDAGKPVCGICLTEEGKNTIRGTLNCCSHYFCFACIMEWSKVESRCPLCKQRFITISKPVRCAKGFDLRSPVIQIPERDQVYQPSEEELRDFLSPYENVICTECHHGGDDALMLLCDLCDSPAHTYCVGLGHEVPEGSWYCDGCRPIALGSPHSQSQDLTPDQRTSTDAIYGAPTYENMAEIDLNVTIPETPVSQGNGFLSPPRYSGGSFQAATSVYGTGVSTVSGRRRIHDQIRALLLTSRLGQMPPGADLDTLRSILGVGVTSTFQQGRTTGIGSSHHVENPPHSVQIMDVFSGSLDHMVGQVGQSSTSIASANNQWSGPDRTNLGASQTRIASSEQVCPCTSRSSIGVDIGASPSHNRVEDCTCIVKEQVHAIVNCQLKSLSQDLDLGHDDYAFITRRATDSIMASYKREPPRRDLYPELLPCCLHVGRVSGVAISPMDECCLTCFEIFAKDVVKRMMHRILGPEHWWRPRK